MSVPPPQTPDEANRAQEAPSEVHTGPVQVVVVEGSGGKKPSLFTPQGSGGNGEEHDWHSVIQTVVLVLIAALLGFNVIVDNKGVSLEKGKHEEEASSEALQQSLQMLLIAKALQPPQQTVGSSKSYPQYPPYPPYPPNPQYPPYPQPVIVQQPPVVVGAAAPVPQQGEPESGTNTRTGEPSNIGLIWRFCAQTNQAFETDKGALNNDDAAKAAMKDDQQFIDKCADDPSESSPAFVPVLNTKPTAAQLDLPTKLMSGNNKDLEFRIAVSPIQLEMPSGNGSGICSAIAGPFSPLPADSKIERSLVLKCAGKSCLPKINNGDRYFEACVEYREEGETRSRLWRRTFQINLETIKLDDPRSENYVSH